MPDPTAPTCPACGGPLPPRQRARPRVWCSDRCRKSRFSVVDPVTGRRRMETPEERRARREQLAELNARLRGDR